MPARVSAQEIQTWDERDRQGERKQVAFGGTDIRRRRDTRRGSRSRHGEQGPGRNRVRRGRTEVEGVKGRWFSGCA